MDKKKTAPSAARLMTLTEAARYLRVRDSVATRWLKKQGLLLNIGGRKRVQREALLAALGAPQPERPREEPEKQVLRVPYRQTTAF